MTTCTERNCPTRHPHHMLSVRLLQRSIPEGTQAVQGDPADFHVHMGLPAAADPRARMDLNPATLGLLLLMIAIGDVVLPLAGTVVTCFGPRRTVTAVAALVGVSLGAVAARVRPLDFAGGAGLFLLGTATGFWDVAVTVHAAAVERRMGRSVMPRFFAEFSLGTVARACLGAPRSAWRVPVGPHIGGVAVAIALTTPVAARNDSDISPLDNETAPVTPDEIPSAAMAHALDPEAARRLWDLSDKLVA
ncbi:hypothetical protein [Streptomyces sp. NPDC003393]